MRSRAGWLDAALFLATGWLIAAWILHFGFIQMGGDGSIILNVEWLQLCGQAPYRDFITGCPPLFLFPLGWLAKLGGVSWAHTTWLVTGYALVIYAWQTALFRAAGNPLRYAVLCAFIIQTITLMPESWWWYNPITGAAAATFVASAIVLTLHPQRRLFQVSLVLAGILVALAKVNTAAPLLIAVTLLLLARPVTRRFAFIFVPSVVVPVLLLFAAEHTSLLYYQQDLHDASARLFDWHLWVLFCFGDGAGDFHMVIFVVIFLAILIPSIICDKIPVLAGIGDRAFTKKALIYLYLVALGIYCLGMISNCDLKSIDAACLVTVALCFAYPAGLALTPRQKVTFYSSYLMIFGLVLELLFIGVTRQRVIAQGPGQFWQPFNTTTLTEPPEFAGLVCGTHLQAVLRESREACAAELAKPGGREKIYFGFRIDSLYPILGVPEPRGLPLWWENVPSTHRPYAYPSFSGMPSFWENPSHWLKPGQPLDQRVQAFLNARYDICVFWRGYFGYADLSYMPDDLRNELRFHYHIVNHYSRIVVFQRNEDGRTADGAPAAMNDAALAKKTDAQPVTPRT